VLASYTDILGDTFSGFISVDGGRCEIAGYPLTDMWSPLLRNAFADFMEVACPQGVYVDTSGGDGIDLLRRPPLDTPFTTIVKVARDRPIAEWRFLHLGDGFRSFGEYQPQTVGAFPASCVADGVCRSYEALLEDGKPGVCRVTGMDDGGATTMYDRLWLPIADGTHEITAFMTIVDITLGLTLPNGHFVGTPAFEAKSASLPLAGGLSGNGAFR